MTANEIRLSGQGVGPQWSPPLGGGEEQLALLWAHMLGEEPQWNRPLSGGKTSPDPRLPGCHRPAAMEPAVSGGKRSRSGTAPRRSTGGRNGARRAAGTP